MPDGLLDLLGAVALLLWGLRVVRTGVSRALGEQLHTVVGRATSNRLSAFLAGCGITLALQSGLAATLLVASFAARSIVAGDMAVAAVLGADVGSAIAARVLALDLQALYPLLLLVGVATFMASGSARWRAVGRTILGLGLVLLSLHLLREAAQPLQATPLLRTVISGLADAPFLGILIAAGLTALMHSSLAVVLLLVALTEAGSVPLEAALVLVLGANLGAPVPALVALAGDLPAARRVAAANLGLRAAAVILLTGFVPALAALSQSAGWTPRAALLDFHLGLNLGLALVFLPVVGPIASLVARLLPDRLDPEDPSIPRHLDRSALDSPSIALASAARETLRIGDLIETMLVRSHEVLERNDSRLLEQLERMDDVVDRLEREVKLYVARLSQAQLDPADTRRASEILSFAVNLEHIGDIIDKGLLDLAAKKIRNRLQFSDEGSAEIEALHARTVANLRLALGVFLSRDEKLARQLLAEKDVIRELERAAAQRHIERLKLGMPAAIQTSSLHLDILRDLKRINAHVASVAYPILDEAGALYRTRLKDPSRA